MISNFLRDSRKLIIVALIVILLMTMFFAITSGNSELSLKSVVNIILFKLTNYNLDSISARDVAIVWNMRLPRILMAILAGIALATAGTLYQGCFRNPLVEPFILGASSGASFGASLAIVLPSLFLPIQISAFLFALLAVAIA